MPPHSDTPELMDDDELAEYYLKRLQILEHEYKLLKMQYEEIMKERKRFKFKKEK